MLTFVRCPSSQNTGSYASPQCNLVVTFTRLYLPGEHPCISNTTPTVCNTVFCLLSQAQDEIIQLTFHFQT